jgi:hypothetical protein
LANVSLRDILINARQEAARMNHHFIGVEHLVAGALVLRGGIASSLFERYGYKPEYVIDAIRRHAGKGSKQRLWAGLPNSPRAEMVLGIANDLAGDAGRAEADERDLLLAVVDEGDSIPMRVFRRLGIDTAALRDDIVGYSGTSIATQPYVRVDFGRDYNSDVSLTEEHLFLLRRMFYGYSRVRVEQRLTGGFTRALLLIVTPIQADSVEDAPVVVKIDDADDILEEAQRYDQQVKNTLPPLTARLEDRPIAPETSELAGLKYTLVAGMDGSPQDLRAAAQTLGMASLAAWLKVSLYPTFGALWWGQRRPYRFAAWEEYDFLLPPLLVLDQLASGESAPNDAHFLRDPLRRERLGEIEYGDVVVVAGFVVHKVIAERDALQLVIGGSGEAAKRAHRIEVRGIDFSRVTHYRGEVIEQMAGRVYAMRGELLLNAARALEPDFDLLATLIPIFRGEPLAPNPLNQVEVLLNRQIDGSLSRIHGDLHMGNILLGPGQSAFLIDFACARSGHTLFDWATLEISLLNELVMRQAGTSWADARRVIERVAALRGAETAPDPLLDDALSPVESLREIVGASLAAPEEWSEYWVALALCALRAVTWETMPISGRRLMLLLAGYCCGLLLARGGGRAGDTLSGGIETDYGDSSNKSSG